MTTSGGTMKYTQGPWEIATGSTPGDGERCAIVAGLSIIAKCLHSISDIERTRANAKLIAKAPEMAELLKQLRDFMESALLNSPHAENLKHYDSQIDRVLREAGVL